MRKSVPRSSRQLDHTKPHDHHKEMQTEVVWTCLPSIRSGQNHLARHSERRKKTRQTKEEVGRQHWGMDKPGVCQVPESSEEQRKMEETDCELICRAPTTLTVKGWVILNALLPAPEPLTATYFSTSTQTTQILCCPYANY